MVKKVKRLLVLVLTVAMITAMVSTVAFASEEEQIKRISGDNRWVTSARTALEAYDSVDNVIIVHGENHGQWADGLAGGYLAGLYNAPILITPTGSLPEDIENAIDKLGAKTAFVLGGKNAVSPDIHQELRGMDLKIEPVAGSNRYETAAKIAERGSATDNTAFIAQGHAPADSMLAGAAAAKYGYPILLVARDRVPDVTTAAINNLGIEKLIIVGGDSVVSPGVKDTLSGLVNGNIERLAGGGRVETGLEVAADQFPDAKDFSVVNGFTGLADAVGASVFKNPILYVSSDEIGHSVENHLFDNVAHNSNICIFGGRLAVGEVVKGNITDIVEEEKSKEPKEPEPELKIIAVSIISNTTVQVTTTPIPEGVTIDRSDFRVRVDGSTRSIDNYSAVSATEHQLTISPPVLSSGQVVVVEGADDLAGSEAEVVMTGDNDILFTEEQDDVEVWYGAGSRIANIRLPSSVRVRMPDETWWTLPVISWTSDTYNSNKEGIYEFEGELDLIGGVSNTLGVTAKANVVVAPEERTVSGAVVGASASTINIGGTIYRVQTEGTDILPWLDNPNVREGLKSTIATVQLNENGRIKQVYHLLLNVGDYSGDHFEALAGGGHGFNSGFLPILPEAPAPHNLIIEGQTGCEVQFPDTPVSSLGNLNITDQLSIVGGLNDDRNLVVTNVRFSPGLNNSVAIVGDYISIYDSVIDGLTSDLIIDGDYSHVDRLEVGQDILIARNRAVEEVDIRYTECERTLDLSTAHRGRMIDVVNGHIGTNGNGSPAVQSSTEADRIVFEETTLGDGTPTTNKVLLQNTSDIEFRNLEIRGGIDDQFNLANDDHCFDLTMRDVTVEQLAFGTNTPPQLEVIRCIFECRINISHTIATEALEPYRFSNTTFLDTIVVGDTISGTATSGRGAGVDVRDLVFDNCVFDQTGNIIVNSSQGDPRYSVVEFTGLSNFRGSPFDNVIIPITAATDDSGDRVELYDTVEGNRSLVLDSAVAGWDNVFQYKDDLVLKETDLQHGTINVTMQGDDVTWEEIRSANVGTDIGTLIIDGRRFLMEAPVPRQVLLDTPLEVLGRDATINGHLFRRDVTVGDRRSGRGRNVSFNGTYFLEDGITGQKPLISIANQLTDDVTFSGINVRNTTRRGYDIESYAKDTLFHDTTFQQDGANMPTQVRGPGWMNTGGESPRHGRLTFTGFHRTSEAEDISYLVRDVCVFIE